MKYLRLFKASNNEISCIYIKVKPDKIKEFIYIDLTLQEGREKHQEIQEVILGKSNKHKTYLISENSLCPTISLSWSMNIKETIGFQDINPEDYLHLCHLHKLNIIISTIFLVTNLNFKNMLLESSKNNTLFFALELLYESFQKGTYISKNIESYEGLEELYKARELFFKMGSRICNNKLYAINSKGGCSVLIVRSYPKNLFT